MVESASDPEVEENPDVRELFRHYDKLYFRGALEDAAFTVEWTSPRVKNISGFGSCSFGKSKTITLYQPMLQHRTKDDLKNALLHLMIHAVIFVKHGSRNLSCLTRHGPVFRDWMDAINTCSIEDCLRPNSGYCITTTHDFSLEDIQSIQGNLWKCESCANTPVRATKLGPPSDSCCIENVNQHATCGNMLCNWHNHKINCGGTYLVPGKQGQKMVRKGYAGGRRGLLTETSEMSKSQEAVQESDSDEVVENCTVAKPKAECKLLSQVGGSNARSPGSSFSKKASKSNMMPEDFQKAIVLHPESTSRKARTWQKPKGVALPPPPKKLKLDKDSADKQGDTKPLGSSTRNKGGKVHKPEGIQKASVVPASPPRKPKQDLVASEKNEVSYFVRRSNANARDKISSEKAHKQREPEETRKPIAQPAVLQSVPKQQSKTNSTTKAEKPAVSQSKLKQSNRAVPERQKKTRSVARERRGKRKRKEYACYSVWAGIYESECSSGSAEPLVNKRTERRKREKERAAEIAQLRSRKKPSAQPAEEEVSSEQVKPPAQSPQCFQFNVPRDQSKAQAPRCKGNVVPTQTPGGRSQPPAACATATAQVFPSHSADPPSLTPSNPSRIPEVVDISDDD